MKKRFWRHECDDAKMPPKKRHSRKKKSGQSSYPNFELKVTSCPLSRHPGASRKTPRTKSYDKGGVARLYSPFNRFGNPRAGDKHISMPFQSPYIQTGLSPKEKSYVIASCQARTTRYAKLKALASTAIKQHKIFSIYGCCVPVRKALLERGWVEKIPANRMNLSKIRNGKFSDKSDIHGELERLLLSNLVEKCNPNFVWKSRDDDHDNTIDINKDNNTIVNKLRIDALWTTKQGLCSSIKRNYWFYIEDVAEVNCPRTYNSSEPGEIDDFVKDYKTTACTSLLKWVLSMVSNDRPVFQDTGNVPLNIIEFAMNRCKEYLYRKQNKDIDRSVGSVSNGQWNAFLKKYYRIIEKEDVFQPDRHNCLPLYLGYSKMLLKEIHKYRPQLSCEGCHNIWIIKPANCSRGRGIRMASKLGVMTNLLNKANSKYVIQKYIEEPFLIHDTKFDIRQYYLVTSTYPLIIWCYTECYLKFSSQKYSLKNYHESIHLTNNAVQKRYKNCLGRHSELPPQNMWDLKTFKDYLNRIGKDQVWDNIIYPGMIKSIISIMLSCQDSLSVSKNRFEMYGCDFILDKEYKPWLIEINSCPDLNHTTPVTAKICPAAITDIIKVVIDRAANPKASTGNFECVYHQPMTNPRYGSAAHLVVRGYSLPNDYFYKGNIEIKESYEDPVIGKELNLKKVLHELKRHYDFDIMMEPEDEGLSEKKIERETCTHVTESEDDMSAAASVITQQIQDLIDRITSEITDSCKSVKNIASLCSLKSVDRCQSPKSLTDINSFMKTCSRGVSSGHLFAKKSFSFSKLDDGPLGKASCFDIVDYLKFPHEKDLIISARGRDLTASKLNIAETTSKLITFINKKEKEYLGR